MADIDRLLEPKFFGERVKIECWIKLWEWKELQGKIEENNQFKLDMFGHGKLGKEISENGFPPKLTKAQKIMTECATKYLYSNDKFWFMTDNELDEITGIKDLESQVAQLKEEKETICDNLGNQLQVKILEINKLKEEDSINRQLIADFRNKKRQLVEQKEQLKSTLDEIKKRYDYLNNFKGIRKEWHNRVVEELGKLLAKDEDKHE